MQQCRDARRRAGHRHDHEPRRTSTRCCARTSARDWTDVVPRDRLRRGRRAQEAGSGGLRRSPAAAAASRRARPLAIEDSPAGVAAARAVGIPVIVTRSAYFADATDRRRARDRPRAAQRRRLAAGRSHAAPTTSRSDWTTSSTGARGRTRLFTSARPSGRRHRMHPTFLQETFRHGSRFTAPGSRPRRRARLRRARVQRQQPRADPRDHGGGAGDPVAGDPAGLGRRPQVRGRTVPAPHGAGGGRGAPGHPGRAAPGPRRIAGRVPAVDPLRLHQRDDGRLAARKTPRPRRATTTTSRSRARCASSRTRSACRSRASSAAWARWKPARPARRTAPAPKAS